MNEEEKGYIEGFAGETLETFQAISSQAQVALGTESAIGADGFMSMNTWTESRSVQQIDRLNQQKRDSNLALKNEPAIARVVVDDFEGERETYFICRAMPPSRIGNLKFASYRAPVGRFASLEVGDVTAFPNGKEVEVVERALLRPTRKKDGWDSINTVIESAGLGLFTVESLRALLAEIAGEAVAEDLVGQLLVDEQIQTNVVEGMRRSVITKMGLRDQPVLDKYQDEIFRLPLNKRLVIFGPPGTGKTTTLIRRLGQKLDQGFLDEGEQALIRRIGETTAIPHASSWTMFTPTALLKQYLKEAFSREGVPAPDQRIRTWSDYRRELSRNAFGILRTASGGGTFVLKDVIQHLADDCELRAIKWFEDFEQWQNNEFIRELTRSTERLKDDSDSKVAKLGEKLASIVKRADRVGLPGTLVALADEADTVSDVVTRLKEDTDTAIKKSLNRHLNRDKGMLDDLAKLIDDFKDQADADDDDADEQDADDDAGVPMTSRARAVAAYMQAVRAQARAAATKRSVGTGTRNGKILAWLGERSLESEKRVSIGEKLVLQTNARRFTNPVRRFLRRLPGRYRAFRRLRQGEGIWYTKDLIGTNDLHPLELDVILLSILRAGGALLTNPRVVKSLDHRLWSSLEPLASRYQTQVLVDEATDFSPLQLACMAGLCQPDTRSFFACGDFNQRLTTWGSRSLKEVKWIFPDIEIKEVRVAYRQSRQLNDLAIAIIDAMGASGEAGALPENVDSEGVAPALLESVSATTRVVQWLAARIQEIERFVRTLPSTAIFVNDESEVQPLADALNEVMVDYSVPVVACSQGQVMGNDNDVRVFAVEHIKGLEFEAVFFIGVDRLATLHPQLFDKYLYVGTTRAATYLGITCDNELPVAIAALRPMFVSSWESPRTAA